MANSLCSIYYEDASAKSGVFSFLIDQAYNVAPYTELLALLQALRNSTQATIRKVTIADELDISGLSNGVATNTGSFDRIADQAILAFRDTVGLDVKLSVPAPVDTLFYAAGPGAMQDIDPTSAQIVAIVAAGVTEPVLVSKPSNVLAYRKGWRKGQPHS